MSFLNKLEKLSAAFQSSPDAAMTRDHAAISSGAGIIEGARNAGQGDSDPGARELVHGLGGRAMARIAWQLISHRRKVLVSLAELPRRLGPVQKVLLRCVDGILAGPDVTSALAQMGVPRARVFQLGQAPDRGAYLACPLNRSRSDARRLLYVGELSPVGGAFDFLSCAISWAEQHPETPIDITWLGEGDLRGVLQAQLVPANLTQVFARIPPAGELAAIMARRGLLVVPSLSETGASGVDEGMAAGLPVLGSIHNSRVKGLVVPNQSGWLFDPLRAGEMYDALDAAITTPAGQLDMMRAAARARMAVIDNARIDGDIDQMQRPRRAPGRTISAPA